MQGARKRSENFPYLIRLKIFTFMVFEHTSKIVGQIIFIKFITNAKDFFYLSIKHIRKKFFSI